MFKVNEKQSELIVLQRTGYNIDALNLDGIGKAYYNDMCLAFSDIEHFLPENCESVIDIGCGIGGIDVLISRAYGNCKFHMVDRDGMENEIYYGFRHVGAKYNLLSLTKDFMVDNGVSNENIMMYDVDAGEFPENMTATVIMSLLSWGFHYPVSTYIDRVFSLMNDDSCLIMDIRKHSNGEAELQKYFKTVKSIKEYSKCNRVLALKK